MIAARVPQTAEDVVAAIEPDVQTIETALETDTYPPLPLTMDPAAGAIATAVGDP